jgi:hypothetical protein
MNVGPPSGRGKALQAAGLWLCAVIVGVIFWEVALRVIDCELKSPPSDAGTCPVGVLFGTYILLRLRLEDGIHVVAMHHWPAMLIASLVATWIVSNWWRRG